MTSNLVEALDELLLITSIQLFRNSSESRFIILPQKSQQDIVEDTKQRTRLRTEMIIKKTI